MSMHAVPIIFFNLGGEMLYVLDQRLRAQNIAQTKGKTVMGDIVTTMFKNKLTDQLMKPQPMYSRNAMRSLFDKLVHSSIMTIETDSMDKLYDLMVMAFKYEILQCLHPKDLIHITLNHFDTILKFVPPKSEARKLILEVHEKFVEIYDGLSHGDFVVLRQLILAFLQDAKNKVSVFINSNTQNSHGYFVTSTNGPVAKDSDVPGVIRNFDGSQKDKTFSTGCNFTLQMIEPDISFEIGGKRGTKLGCNLYANDCSLGHQVAKNSYQSSNQHLAKAELNLLAHLMGSDNSNAPKEFKLDLFGQEDESDTLTSSKKMIPQVSSANVVTVHATKAGEDQLSQIMSDFNISSTQKESGIDENDLLSLMDNA